MLDLFLSLGYRMRVEMMPCAATTLAAIGILGAAEARELLL